MNLLVINGFHIQKKYLVRINEFEIEFEFPKVVKEPLIINKDNNNNLLEDAKAKDRELKHVKVASNIAYRFVKCDMFLYHN